MRISSVQQKDYIRISEKLGKIADKFDNCSILITGSSGFLGKYLTEYFISRGLFSELTLCDLKPETYSDNRVASIEIDVAEPFTDEFKQRIRNADWVFHFASIASPVFYRKHPMLTINGNINGLTGIIENVDPSRILGILYMSSSEIYGDPDKNNIPTNEEYRGNVSCTGPRSCYDETKRFGETLCKYYAESLGINIGVARPFNNYGPCLKLDDGRLPADLIKSVIRNQDFELFSDGKPTRTFCYVSDAIEGYLRVVAHGQYDYFNIGMDAGEISVLEFSKMFLEIAHDQCSYSGKFVHSISKDKHYLTDNPNRRMPSIAKARQTLDYNPEVTVDEGIRRYIAHCLEMNV